jgi:hypothetical protein
LAASLPNPAGSKSFLVTFFQKSNVLLSFTRPLDLTPHKSIPLKLLAMSESSTATITGLWHGQFDYPEKFPAEFFQASLVETPDYLGGSIQETLQHGKHAGRTFYATVSGRRSGSLVSFLKTYESAPRVHIVHYLGTLNDDATEIEGTWSISANWSGRFMMIRASGLPAAVRIAAEQTI